MPINNKAAARALRLRPGIAPRLQMALAPALRPPAGGFVQSTWEFALAPAQRLLHAAPRKSRGHTPYITMHGSVLRSAPPERSDLSHAFCLRAAVEHVRPESQEASWQHTPGPAIVARATHGAQIHNLLFAPMPAEHDPKFVYDPAYEAAARVLAGRDLADWYKRRYTPYDLRPGRGGRKGSHDGLARGRQRLVTCRRPGCDALVQLGHASRGAALAGRATYAAGDGCGSRLCCTGVYHRGRWEARQRVLRAQMLSGARSVTSWPECVPVRADQRRPRAHGDLHARGLPHRRGSRLSGARRGAHERVRVPRHRHGHRTGFGQECGQQVYGQKVYGQTVYGPKVCRQKVYVQTVYGQTVCGRKEPHVLNLDLPLFSRRPVQRQPRRDPCERRFRARSDLLVEQGIEPHPGPPLRADAPTFEPPPGMPTAAISAVAAAVFAPSQRAASAILPAPAGAKRTRDGAAAPARAPSFACVFRSGLAFGGVRVRCLCVRCVLCLLCLPLRVRPRVCPVPVLRFWIDNIDVTLKHPPPRPSTPPSRSQVWPARPGGGYLHPPPGLRSVAGPTCYPPPGITCISWRLEIPIIASFLSICLDFFWPAAAKALDFTGSMPCASSTFRSPTIST